VQFSLPHFPGALAFLLCLCCALAQDYLARVAQLLAAEAAKPPGHVRSRQEIEQEVGKVRQTVLPKPIALRPQGRGAMRTAALRFAPPCHNPLPSSRLRIGAPCTTRRPPLRGHVRGCAPCACRDGLCPADTEARPDGPVRVSPACCCLTAHRCKKAAQLATALSLMRRFSLPPLLHFPRPFPDSMATLQKP